MQNNHLLAGNGLPAFDRIRPEHVEHAVLATLDANRAELEQLLAAAEQLELEFDAAVWSSTSAARAARDDTLHSEAVKVLNEPFRAYALRLPQPVRSKRW